MNIKDIKYYCSLVEEKNFSKVAEIFKVSQPTITMAIKRLEKEFDAPFFIRDQSHRELRITTAGEQFYMHAQAILTEIEVARKEIISAQEGKIRFGLPPIIGNYYFPPLSPGLMKEGILQRLETYEYGSAHLLKMVQRGDLDMALLGSLKPINYPRLRTRVLATFPINIIVSKKHPLAIKKDTGVAFADLKNEPFLALAKEAEFIHQQAFRTMTQQNHFRAQISYQTNDVHILKSMVADNLGIAYLTDLAVLDSDNVVRVPLTDPDAPVFMVSSVSRTTTPMNSTKQALWDGLLTAAK